jgi:ribosomal protein S18 acetylase RimI-like enzyme
MIRFATYDDYKQISEMLKDIHGMHVKAEPSYYKNVEEVISVKDFNEEVDKKHVFVYDTNDKIIGYVIFAEMVIQNHPIINDQRVFMIDDIYVLPSERGKGIGRQLFSYIEKYAKDNKYTNIDLNVWTFNVNALKYYKSMGMRETRVKMSKKI